ncbi:MAG: AMP-binding protein [Rubrivivax sp.]|nr:AMP-binding protein [Rubrivivax sp.]
MITIPQLLGKVSPAAERVPSIRETIVFGEAPGATPFMALMADAPAPPKVEIDPARDVAALPFSSGTSGTPKGVMLTHRNLVANVAQFTNPQPLAGPDDVVLGILPFFHIYGLVVILGGSFREGVKVVSMPRFELEPLLQAMQDHKVSIAMLVPPLVLAFAKHPVIAKYDLGAMHTHLPVARRRSDPGSPMPSGNGSRRWLAAGRDMGSPKRVPPRTSIRCGTSATSPMRSGPRCRTRSAGWSIRRPGATWAQASAESSGCAARR